MVGFGDTRPLEPIWIRATIICIAAGAVALYYGIRLVLKRRAQLALEQAIAESGLRVRRSILKARMGEAIATLKRTGKRRNFLYGSPGTSSSARQAPARRRLWSIGAQVSVAGSGEAQPVSGVGGTRYCDWWFTEEAVIIDTAGRYTTQDSDGDNDKKSWLAFLTCSNGIAAASRSTASSWRSACRI